MSRDLGYGNGYGNVDGENREGTRIVGTCRPTWRCSFFSALFLRSQDSRGDDTKVSSLPRTEASMRLRAFLLVAFVGLSLLSGCSTPGGACNR